MKYLVFDPKSNMVIDSLDSETGALYSAEQYREKTGRRADVYTLSSTFESELRGGFTL